MARSVTLARLSAEDRLDAVPSVTVRQWTRRHPDGTADGRPNVELSGLYPGISIPRGLAPTRSA